MYSYREREKKERDGAVVVNKYPNDMYLFR